eukprot:3384693-Rhodomonas_salina.1
MSQCSSVSAAGLKSCRFHSWNTMTAERQPVRIARGTVGSARCSATAMAASSPRISTASPPTLQLKLRAGIAL